MKNVPRMHSLGAGRLAKSIPRTGSGMKLLLGSPVGDESLSIVSAGRIPPPLFREGGVLRDPLDFAFDRFCGITHLFYGLTHPFGSDAEFLRPILKFVLFM